MRCRFIGLLMFCCFIACKTKPEPLPYLQDKSIRVPPFKLLNQDSTIVTQEDFDGKIYVADFFFTSCPTICPVMHRNLLKVYRKYEGNRAVKFASHTIDAKYDTPSRMKIYANKLGIRGTQWEFLWGTRDQIYALAQRNYIVAVKEDPKENGGFVHQGYLILVDKQKRIRGAYDGTLEPEVKKMMADMDVLLNE